MRWHARLLDAYKMSENGNRSVGDNGNDVACRWWDLDSNKYMMENVDRHLLGAGRASEVLRLLTDYRWV